MSIPNRGFFEDPIFNFDYENVDNQQISHQLTTDGVFSDQEKQILIDTVDVDKIKT